MRTVAALLIILAFAAHAGAEEFKSGIPVGESFGTAFHVIGITGPDAGKTYCQVCKYGPRPVAIVFTRTADARLAALVKALDAQVAEHEAQGLRAFLCALGTVEVEELKKLGDDTKPRLPLTLGVEQAGPPAYKLHDDAAVTVIISNAKRKVTANFAFKDIKDLTDAKVEEIAKACGKAVE